MFVGACGYLAAVYLVGEAARRGDRRLQAYFTRRAQAAGIVTGALSLATLAELHSSNAALFSRLTGRALPLVIARRAVRPGRPGPAHRSAGYAASGSSPRSGSPP